VRQLSHVIEQGYVLDCPPRVPSAKRSADNSRLPYLNLNKLRDTAIRQALELANGHKGRAAKLLGVHANTLTRLFAQLEGDAAATDES
jgi:DNA-binding NtrC family response regulator